MEIFHLMLFIVLGLTVTAEELIKKKNLITSNNSNNNTSEMNSIKSDRRGKQMKIDRIEIPFSETGIKKHIVKIPPNVSKVKLINTIPVARPTKINQQKGRYPIPLIPLDQTGIDDDQIMDYDEINESLNYDPKSIKRNFIEIPGQGPDFIENRESKLTTRYYSNIENNKMKKLTQPGKRISIKMKTNFPQQSPGIKNIFQIYKKPNKFLIKNEYKSLIPTNSFRPDKNDLIFFDNESAESLMYKKHLTMSNTRNHNMEKQIIGNMYDSNYRSPFNMNVPLSKPRKILNPQYTTHNPHVVTNFGLSGFSSTNHYLYKPKIPFTDPSLLKYESSINVLNNNPLAVASSNHVSKSVPVVTPGIKVIKPPQFGEISIKNPGNPSKLVSTPWQQQQQQEQYSNQKATIRDILEHDCPNHEMKGFCESPPRYPTHQIGTIVQKCVKLLEAMSTQNLIDHQDSMQFSSRSDVDVDNNTSSIMDSQNDQHVVRKRSTLIDGIQACQSEFSLIEPGYAKEVTTGRWFVIVQHSEMSQQRITTDTCKNPGKPCSGLNDMKCIKMGNLTNKTTKCVQRFSYHRLISWDPDVPELCPRMRIFKFPSACVCHLGVPMET